MKYQYREYKYFTFHIFAIRCKYFALCCRNIRFIGFLLQKYFQPIFNNIYTSQCEGKISCKYLAKIPIFSQYTVNIQLILCSFFATRDLSQTLNRNYGIFISAIYLEKFQIAKYLAITLNLISTIRNTYKYLNRKLHGSASHFLPLSSVIIHESLPILSDIKVIFHLIYAFIPFMFSLYMTN